MNDMTQLPLKKSIMQTLLLRGSVFMHINPKKCPGVKVPSRLINQDQIVLQVGLDMPVPIPDLLVDETGVRGTLSFKGVPFLCVIPWDSIFALIGEDAKGCVWQADIPPSVSAMMTATDDKLKPAPVIDLAAYRTRKNHEKMGA